MANMRVRIGIVMTLVTVSETVADNLPDSSALQNQGAVIGEIVLDKSDVFDLSNPKENKALYRLANRLHIITKDKVIKQQLLFKTGDPYKTQLIDESGRILRQNRYLYNAEVKPIRVRNGIVDVSVATRDVWSLGPDLSFSRSGGENRSRYGLEETNLLGRGQTLRVVHGEDVDRKSDSIEFYDRNLGYSRVAAFLGISRNSDGRSNRLSIIRPFYALDARWSAGARMEEDDRRSTLYVLGDEAAEYQHERRAFSAFGGYSKGLRDGAARRWTFGIAHDDNRFSDVVDPALPAMIPQDRKLIYGFARFEYVQDAFKTTRNRDQIGKTEDFLMGTRLSATLGWSDRSLGADRDALIYSTTFSRGFGSLEKNALLLAAAASGRIESGHAANSKIVIDARYYRTQSPKRLFFATINATAGHALDLDNPTQIGGDNGLRGYPLRYQNGESKLLVTIEQRYFTDWHPFQLARIGGAIFADAGRLWGSNPLDVEDRGWLTDIGIGLRIAPTRNSSRKIVHLDLAFPLNGDDSIDDVQILLEARHGF